MQFDDSFNKSSFLKYYFSKYFWCFLIAFCFLLRIIFPVKFISIPINSLTRKEPFSNTSEPTFFSHLTDIHITGENPDTKNYETALKQLQKINTKTVVISGDLTRNFIKDGPVQYTGRVQNERSTYTNLTEEALTHVSQIFDISGNHDVWEIYNWESEMNDLGEMLVYYKQFDNLTYDQFLCSTAKIGDSAFILINSLRFPVPHASYDFYAMPTREHLDQIEKEINTQKKQASHIYIINHYPAKFWVNIAKTTSGKTFLELLEESNADLYLSGHLHPKNPLPIHHKGVTEIIGVDISTNFKSAFVTEDNGNIAYHSFNITDDVKAFVVNPPPMSQIGEKSYFNDDKTNVKLLVFTDKDNEIIHVNGIKLDFIRFVSNNSAIYAAQLPRYEGQYTLTFDGYFNDKIECYSGETVPKRKEEIGIVYSLFYCAQIWIIIQMLILIFITFPIDFSKYFEKVKKIQKNVRKFFSTKHYFSFETIFYCLFGFIPLRIQILKYPLWTRILLFFCVFFPFFLPFVFVRIDGHLGICWAYGYIFGTNFVIDPSGMMYTFVYEEAIVTAIIFFASMVSAFNEIHWTILFDIIFILAFIIGDCIMYYMFIFQNAGFVNGLLSPLFMFTPIIYFMLILISKKQIRNEKSDSLTVMIAHQNSGIEGVLSDL